MNISQFNILSLIRALCLVLSGLILNIAIFILIQQLVSKERELIKTTHINLVNFIYAKQKPKPPKPKDDIEYIKEPSPEEKPLPPEITQPQVDKPKPVQTEIPIPEITLPLSINGMPYLGDFAKSINKKLSNQSQRLKIASQVQPISRIAPQYPIHALRNGIEGFVIVEFIIDINGSVKEPKIVESNPNGIFDKSVLAVITQWKFNPDVVNGQTVERYARQEIKFTLQR